MPTNMEYLGHFVSEKNSYKSFKDRTLTNVDKVDYKNMYKASIDEEPFNIIQALIVVKKNS